MPSGEAYWELFSTSYGPTKTLVEAIGDRSEDLHRDWVEFFETNYTRRRRDRAHARVPARARDAPLKQSGHAPALRVPNAAEIDYGRLRSGRLARLQEALRPHELPVCLFYSPANVRVLRLLERYRPQRYAVMVHQAGLDDEGPSIP